MLISDDSCDNKTSSSFIHVSLAMVALGRPWAYSKRGWSGLIAGKTDEVGALARAVCTVLRRVAEKAH